MAEQTIERTYMRTPAEREAIQRLYQLHKKYHGRMGCLRREAVGKDNPRHVRNVRQARKWDVERAKQRAKVVLWRGSKEQSDIKVAGKRRLKELEEEKD